MKKKTNLKLAQAEQQSKNQPETAVKVFKSDTIEACLVNENNAEFWTSWHDLKLLIQLPDGSQWGPMFSNSRPGGSLFQPYHLPYVDIYDRHVNRRHRNQLEGWGSEASYIVFVVRADRAEPKIFCHCCGWLNPVQDPEILGRASTAKPDDARTEDFAGRRQEERRNIRANEKEFRSALNRLIEEIENRLINSAFSLEGGFGSVDNDIMSTLEPLFEPGIPFDRKFLKDEFEQLIENEVSRAQDDALSNLEWNLRRTYFNAGVLMGARLKGASIEELRKLGERWWQM